MCQLKNERELEKKVEEHPFCAGQLKAKNNLNQSQSIFYSYIAKRNCRGETIHAELSFIQYAPYLFLLRLDANDCVQATLRFSISVGLYLVQLVSLPLSNGT